MRTISIAIPTWEREALLFESFAQVYDDPRISEIVIVDDCSNLELFNRIKERCDKLPKVRLYRNVSNVDCFRNKMTAASYTTNDWVCVWDSDNVFGTDYLDAIYAIENWDKYTFYLPEFARPNFSALQWSGLTVTKENVSQYADTHLATNLNAFNLFINREEYLRIWDGSVDPITSDSLYVSYCWLNAGNKIYVTPSLQYFHRVGNHGSHYVLNQHKTVDFHKKLMEDIRLMK